MNISKFLPFIRVARVSSYTYSLAYNPAAIKTITRNIKASRSFNMAQRTITSFFKVTPPKTDVKDKKVEVTSNGEGSSPDEAVKRSSKRARVETSESEPEAAKTPSPEVHSEKKKKPKRQRIESTDSETEPIPDNPPSPKSPDKPSIKLEKTSPKTYQSPKTKKAKPLTEKNTPKEKSPKGKSKLSDNSPKSTTKIKTKVEEKSPKTATKVKKESKIKKETVTNSDKSPESGVRSSSSDEETPTKENVEVDRKPDQLVPELEYNPSKARYEPVSDACWAPGQPVPYLALARTLQAVEATAARLRMVHILANYLRSVVALTPRDLLPSVYLCLNQLAPAYESLELGIAETYLMKAIGACTGRTLAQVRTAARAAGDLAAVAAAARSSQRTLVTPPPLAVRRVYAALKEVAAMTGQSSVNKKISKIQTLYVACRDCEAKFLIRSLEGKLRIGLAEQSVLQALAVAVTLTPPVPVEGEQDARKLSPEALKARIEANALTIKTVYCECPDYGRVLPALLAQPPARLPALCPLACGTPLKPMLAHPTKRIQEIFDRFEGVSFTCEWKYDGERAQIHVPRSHTDTSTEPAPDFQRAAIFSRNQENNTSKYPDILGRLPALLKPSVQNCILDCEAVAYDLVNKQILPFQVLSTRKRKDAAAADIRVQVCVFVFDLLLLNDESLVRQPLQRRRQLLREHFQEVPGEWEFARSKDCTSMEEVQLFLEESVKGSCEGLMVKTLTGDHAHYHIARRSKNWLKLKKDYLEGVGDTLDVVVLGAYRGKGRRAATYGGFLCFVRGDGDDYQSLCKIGTGFSDDDLTKFTEELDKHKIDGPRSYYRYESSLEPDAWFSAESGAGAVWEVRCADLSLSPLHRAALGLVDPGKGISIRFPRFVRVRPDKSPEQATTARQVADMYLSQDQLQNQVNKPQLDLDDFY